MKDFIYEELKIEVTKDNNEIMMRWHGRSRGLDITKKLISYFDEFCNDAEGNQLKIDFTKLEMISSSTVPSIIKLIKKLDDSKVKTEILYDGKSDWQNSSFKALESIIEIFKNINLIKM